jgi:hypothetical protein
MPNGFWYASGPQVYREIKAGSAFSKGDLLTLDSNSSLSRLNPYAATTATQYAVALSDSTNSINGVCVVQEITPTTRFWSRTTSGVTLIRGEESGVSFVAAAPGRQWVDESSTTNIVVVDFGTAEVDQSVESKVIVRFKYADSELDLS